jgi:predicted DNA binding CopG/RHH family protein
MRTEYDFSKARKNPYAKLLKQSVTIRLDAPTIEYFKSLSAELDLPYQTLINLYLRDCAQSQRKPNLRWRPRSVGVAG